MSTSNLGSAARPLRVAVIGSGPSAFYAVEALFKTENLAVRCDVFDRLPTPFGLVRGGVAPDHQKIKNVTRVYDKVAADPRFRFFGNVMLGRDLQVGDLQEHYDHIVYAVGNEDARALGIEGEDLPGVHSATEFVFWYNGHPEYQDRRFDLQNARRVAVVGNGNVAMDVCRVLIQDKDRLAQSDVADQALAALREAPIEEVILLGRRGPAQAAFSTKEIKEVAELEGVQVVVDPAAVEPDPVTQAWLEGGDAPKAAQRNLDFLTACSQTPPQDGQRRVLCRFLVSPVALAGEGRLQSVRLQHSELYAADDGTPRPRGLDQHSEEPIDLLFKAIGYRGTPIPGVPYHESWGIIPNQAGRVTDGPDGAVIPGQYVVGWAKRGPSGLIGTNSPDSKATVQLMVEDLSGATGAALPTDEAEAIVALLQERGVRSVSYADWQKLDALEQERGKASGRPRVKFTSIAEMLAALE